MLYLQHVTFHIRMECNRPIWPMSSDPKGAISKTIPREARRAYLRRRLQETDEGNLHCPVNPWYRLKIRTFPKLVILDTVFDRHLVQTFDLWRSSLACAIVYLDGRIYSWPASDQDPNPGHVALAVKTREILSGLCTGQHLQNQT